MVCKDLEMVEFPKKRGQVGGQCVNKLLPFRPIGSLKPTQVLLKTGVAGVAQPAGQTAINHGVLSVVQTDASAPVNKALHPIEIGIGPNEFSPLHAWGITQGICGNGCIHMASITLFATFTAPKR
jgi:hypothetical protein